MAHPAANTTVNLGSGDSDTYTYDPNTGRMATYQYKVGSTPKYVTGTLGWNQNGTLGSLLIADGFDAANAQNCGYTYDDVARLQSVSCGPTNRDGTTWGQTFAYDPFGNISKSVPISMTGISWLPGYNTNNHYTLGGTSYDGNGNLTADTFNTYAWDSDGNTVGFNLGGSAPINITYDAFDRIVEKNNSGTYKQILYSPIGKLALMTRQVTNNVFLPLPGGEQATYTGNTIRFRHYDWLGSARFESNMAEQEYGDVAYAPFGETYSIKNTPYLSFTGQQQDTVSGTYDFLYREYNPVQGRWISPDPSGLSAVDPTNPQSWNRYAYVLNNPLSNTDPLGLWCYYGTTNDDGSIYLSSSEADAHSGNYDFHSTQSECEGVNGSNGGTWYPDSVDTVTAYGGLPSMIDLTSSTLTSSLTGPANNIPTVSQWRPPKSKDSITAPPGPYHPTVGECITNPGDAVDKMLGEGGGPQVQHDPSIPLQIYQPTQRGIKSINGEEGEAEGAGYVIIFDYVFNTLACLVGSR